MAEFMRHEPCPNCGSKDNLARYADGSAYCFGCTHHEKGTGGVEELSAAPATKDWTPLEGDIVALPKRGLHKETCELYDYRVGAYDDQPCQIANYRDPSRKHVAQKLRLPDKKFRVLGNGKNMPLFGMHLWSRGKYVTITTGEIDAMAVCQAFDLKWPAVSLPNGDQSAARTIEQWYEWLDGFDHIVLMFDMDESGQAAVEVAAPLLPPGKVKVARLPEKDANETLLKHGPAAIVKAFWDAETWKPDGIVSGEEFTVDQLMTAVAQGYDLPRPKLNEALLGLRKGELTLLTAGSGIGKSTEARELAYHLHQAHGLKIGNVFLEENNVKTAQGYVAIDNNVPLGKLRNNPNILPREAWERSVREVINQRMWFYDHFGSLESKNLLSKLRYLAAVLKVDFIILDHISIVVSGQEESAGGERKDIDILMTRLRSLIEETGVGVIAIVHLKQPEGKAHEEGGRVTLAQLRGSGSLKQLSDNVIALERDQQGEKRDYSLVRVLKCRETGETGEADVLLYDREAGRMRPVETPCPFGDAGEDVL
jgi:twinkle protein